MNRKPKICTTFKPSFVDTRRMGYDYNYVQTRNHSCTVSTSSTLTFQNMESMA